MDIKYNVTKLRENKIDEIKDHISVEEPLEINLRFKQNSNWHTENLSITMRTPGNDEDLITGFLFFGTSFFVTFPQVIILLSIR